MRITVTERGQVESQSNVTLKCKVEGTTTIIKIIPEGTVVGPPVVSEIDGEVTSIRETSGRERTIVVQGNDGETVEHPVTLGEFTEVLVEQGDKVKVGQFLAGDVCVDLDASELEEQEKQQQIDVTRAAADLEKAQKDVELQETQTDSDLAAARLTADLAQLDLDNYEKGEYQQQVDTILGKKLIAEQELNQAKENYEFARRVAKKGYKSETEVETARIAVVKAQNTLDTEQGNLDVLQLFTHKRTIKEYTENAKESKRALERVKLSSDAAKAQVEAEHEARKQMYQLEQEKLHRYQQQIEACRMIAPQAGQVVYANQSHFRSQQVIIEEGTTVRENQEIVKLPDFSQMKVDARIHESKISQIRTGLPALIHIDAFPESKFLGIVDTISSVPLPGRFPNYDLKEYEASVLITSGTSQVDQLKPGLTASIEIVVDERENVRQVPVQAIVSIADQHFAYVLTENGPQRRQLQIGDTNDTHMEIIDGLTDGEKVILNPRTNFSDELNELENKFGKPNQEKQQKTAPGDELYQFGGPQAPQKGAEQPGGQDTNGQDPKPLKSPPKRRARGDQSE